MSSISFTAHGRCARATVCEPITTGSVGLSVSFAFDAAWSGLQKTAIFRGSGMAVDLVLSGDAATVPPEVLTIPGGDLRVGVWGADPDGNVIIPTVWANVGEIVPGAAPSGFDPDPPTPSWAAQVQEIAQDALDTANSVREDADAGEFDGADGSPGAPGVSPTVTVTNITGGHRVTITDAAGSSSFDVMDGAPGSPGAPGAPGAPGSPGFSPTVTVTDITGGHRVTITDATGDHSFDVMDGAGGGDILLVKITQSGNYYNADVSMTEIRSAYNAGKTVIAKWGGNAYLYDGNTFARNVTVQPDEVTSQYFVRGSGYRLNYYSKSFFKPTTYYFWLNRDSSRLYCSDVTPAQFIQKDPRNETFTVVCNTVPSQGPSSGDEVYAQLRFDGIYHVYSTNPETGDPIEAIRVQFSGYDVDTNDGTTSLMIAYVDLDILAENTSWYAYNAVVDYYSLM